MTALDRERELGEVGPYVTAPQAGVAANAEKIWEHAMVRATAGGYLVKVGDSTVDGVGPVRGVARFTTEGETGDGDVSLDIYHGVFARPNSGTSPVTWASFGETVYAEDDQTVSSDSSLPVAGTMWGFRPDGDVIFAIGTQNALGAGGLRLLAERTITSADLTTAGVGPETENIGSVQPADAIVVTARSKLDDAFDNGSGVSLAMELGHDNDVDAYEDGFDCFTSSAHEGGGWEYETPGPALGLPPFDGVGTGQLTATFTAGADQLANFTDGSVTVQYWGFIL
jgi:hypothetical protein